MTDDWTLIDGIGTLVTNDPEAGEGRLGLIRDAAVIIGDGSVQWVGASSAVPEGGAGRRIDADGAAVLPGFVDSHSHLVFGGERAEEFAARMTGAAYAAGGIRTTIAATRAASDVELAANTARLAAEAGRQGTTCLEIKSGYGQTVTDEARSLTVAAGVTGETTLLAAHVTPPEYQGRQDDYVAMVINEMIPACAPQAKWIDVFCEEGAFDADQSRAVLTAGMAAGLVPRVHGNQLSYRRGRRSPGERRHRRHSAAGRRFQHPEQVPGRPSAAGCRRHRRPGGRLQPRDLLHHFDPVLHRARGAGDAHESGRGGVGGHRRWRRRAAPHRRRGVAPRCSGGPDRAGRALAPAPGLPTRRTAGLPGVRGGGRTMIEVDRPAAAWSGRDDGPGPEHRRWHTTVRTASAQPDGATGADGATLIGFSSDAGVVRNLGRPGAAAGPGALRGALGSMALAADIAIADAGDVVVPSDADLEPGQARLGAAVTAVLDAGGLPVVLGGGHEVAYGSYLGIADSRAVAEGARFGVLNLDAHFDLRHAPRPSSGTPFRQMAEAEVTAGRRLDYAVVGIAQPSNTPALFAEAEKWGVRYLLDDDCSTGSLPRVESFVDAFLAGIDLLYLTVDLDVLPAAVAPGVSAPAGFGVPLEVISRVCDRVAASGKLALFDVAELNPALDVDGRTARVAARLIHRLVTGRLLH
jgi:formiminoglutamase